MNPTFLDNLTATAGAGETEITIGGGIVKGDGKAPIVTAGAWLFVEVAPGIIEQRPVSEDAAADDKLIVLFPFSSAIAAADAWVLLDPDKASVALGTLEAVQGIRARFAGAAVIFTGIGAPSNSSGIEGDLYRDYGQTPPIEYRKVGGVWQPSPAAAVLPWNPVGAYDPAVTYAKSDLVFHAGSSYVSRQNGNTGNAPADVSAWWQAVSKFGDKGDTGDKGWSPKLVVVVDGPRRVFQVKDWLGGEGPKPPVDEYVGQNGWVSNIADATDLRGPAGAGNGDVEGPANATEGHLAVFGNLPTKILDGGPVGTAASKDVGTAAGNVIALEAGAKLPAVDASQLTNMTKAQVGLGDVDNTADANKPISTDVANALAGKANTVDLGSAAFGDVGFEVQGHSPLLDEFAALSPTIEAGDIIFVNAAGHLQRRGKGANGKVLTMVNDLPDWANSGMAADQWIVNAQLALAAAEGAKAPLALGLSGNRIADSFDATNFLDVAGSSNYDLNVTGQVRPSFALGTRFPPQMTSNTIPAGYVASSSSSYDSNYLAWRAFDRIVGGTSTGRGWITPTNVLTGWCRIQLPAGQIGASYSIASTGTAGDLASMPKAWTIRGTADGMNWDILDERFDEINWSINETRNYTITSPGNYTQYEINITTNNGGNSVCICEVAFYEAGAINALTLLTTSFAAPSTPVAMKGLLLANLGIAVPGTDLLLDYSRNAGGNWAPASFIDRFTIPGTNIHVLETSLVDLTGQPIAAAPKVRLKTMNDKMVYLRGHYFEWI